MSSYMNNGGYSFQRPNFGESLKRFFKQKSALNYLMTINVAVWIMAAFARLYLFLYQSDSPNPLVTWLSVPANLDVLKQRPWSPITYMFMHESFWHLFFNLFMLYFGGKIFVRLTSQRHMVLVYVLGGLMGAAFFVAAYNVFPVFATEKVAACTLGASASVLAILVAAAAYNPQYELHLFLLGSMKFMWLAAILVLIDVLSIPTENPGGHIAHLGGAMFGLIYGFALRLGSKSNAGIPKSKRKPKMEYTPYEEVKDEPEVPRSDEDYNQQKAEKERDVDAILDKIAKSGYGSLTKEEKEFLFKNSR